ncbi:STAS domain-containing protein [Kitasatospora sp. DSM 101779]|uniref:STAS domain-containing protein n=1 Tax=Kitasatospora sp. DSM 101779 TaxID=2853165 RepID=UPI0021D93BE4|nr:STAS domain-containing protein [Kitasatospora sp. DSM 101779]MCU7826835.1 STAS domain-containing protein [Kitasatospora sp. DSM 101779]
MASFDRIAPPVAPAPDLKACTASAGEAVTCSFAGNLHLDSEDQVGLTLREAIGRRPAVLAVDLSAVQVFTSSGLNALLVARRAAHAEGVPMVLVAPSRSVWRVLQITEAHLVLPVFPTVEQALAHQGASNRGASPSPSDAYGV